MDIQETVDTPAAVVIPTQKSARTIVQCLQSNCRQTHSRRTVVVDNGSYNETETLARRVTNYSNGSTRPPSERVPGCGRYAASGRRAAAPSAEHGNRHRIGCHIRRTLRIRRPSSGGFVAWVTVIVTGNRCMTGVASADADVTGPMRTACVVETCAWTGAQLGCPDERLSHLPWFIVRSLFPGLVRCRP